MRHLVMYMVVGLVGVNITSTAMGGWKVPEVYGGIALSGERMDLKRTEGIWDNNIDGFGEHDPNWVTMSHGKKVSDHALTGHVFVGVLWNIPRSCFFVGPELMGGWGSTSQRLQKKRYINWSDTEKSFDATLQRRMNWSAVMRFGMMLPKDYRVYALAGVSREQFRYMVNYHYSSDPDVHIPTQFSRQTKWTTGAVWGIGIEKKIQAFRLGLEARMVHGRTLKYAHALKAESELVDDGAVSGFPELIRAEILPQNISILCRLSYAF